MSLSTVARVYIFDILQLVNYSTSDVSLVNIRHSMLMLEIFCMPMTDMVTQTEQAMQTLMNKLSTSAWTTVLLVMFQPALGSLYFNICGWTQTESSKQIHIPWGHYK